MTRDVVVSGVGGQHALSLGAVLAAAARRDGRVVTLCEVHGMAQRGGSVLAHLRIADAPIHSPLIPGGTADVLLATEPLEALRQVPMLTADGVVVTSVDPYRNISDYPDDAALATELGALPRAILVEAGAVAHRVGATDAEHLVLAGTVSSLLSIRPDSVEQVIRESVAGRGKQVLARHLAAFRGGQTLAP